MRDQYIASAQTRDAFGTQMKKYAICTMISSVVTLLIGIALQVVWFKYDDIIRNNWLRISGDGYTSEELPWIKFCQNSLVAKIIPICSIIVLVIFAAYLVFDLFRDVYQEDVDVDCSHGTLFLAKCAAVGLFSALGTVFLAFASFFGEGCLTYVDSLYLLDERHFVPIGNYLYYEVWSKKPSVNVLLHVRIFLIAILFFLCVYLFLSLARLIAKHTSDIIALVAAFALLVIVGGVCVATKASIIALVIMIVLFFIGGFCFQSFVADKETNEQPA
ncbi:MAG: hypothetical protein J6Y08_04705 [Clostridiales bacterium]|nr:hypothetical protein [Clostridiales bacterium]